MQQLRSRVKGKENIDMTRGNIFLILLQFTLPLLVGNLFQQLYNMVDAWVVGNYVSAAAYSAVALYAAPDENAGRCHGRCKRLSYDLLRRYAWVDYL